jgi:hypothetical protein
VADRAWDRIANANIRFGQFVRPARGLGQALLLLDSPGRYFVRSGAIVSCGTLLLGRSESEYSKTTSLAEDPEVVQPSPALTLLAGTMS